VPVGDDILVGSPWDDGAPCNGTVYLFDGDTHDLVLTLRDNHPITDNPPGNFGHGPSAMGNNILVGDPYADLDGPNSGAAYLIQGIPEPSIFVLLGVPAISLIVFVWQRRKPA